MMRTAPPEPTMTADPKVQLAEHLQASEVLFRQAEKVQGTEDISMINDEIEATGLQERTNRLLQVEKDPQVVEYLNEVQQALRAIRAGELAKLRQMHVSQKVGVIQQKTGIQPKPIQVKVVKDGKSPFYQARVYLYQGDYSSAAKTFEGIKKDDARYWRGFCVQRQGDDQEALRSWMGLSSSVWVDQETLSQIKQVTARLNAKIGDKDASDLKVEDLEKLIKGPACVFVLKSAKSRPVYVMGHPLGRFELDVLQNHRGYSVRKQGNIAWVEIQLDQIGIPPEQQELLIEIIRTSVGSPK
jgi:hypothetical protein